MKISVIINNYNYGRYIQEALESALSQTLSPFEVIIVDDGSTDDSISIIESLIRDNENCNLIKQENQGQLGAIMTGLKAASGDIICLLDADDIYKEKHLEYVHQTFVEHPDIGMRFCLLEKFDKENGDYGCISYFGNLGRTAILTYLADEFIGNPTSSLSFSRKACKRIIPTLEKHCSLWVICADKCLVQAVSLAGFSKYNSNIRSVLYRIHGSNFYARKEQNFSEIMHHRQISEDFLVTNAKDLGFQPQLTQWIDLEYKTSNIIKKSRYKAYRKAIYSFRSPFSFYRKIKQHRKLYKAYCSFRKNKSEEK